MIYEHFRISDADVTVLDISRLLNAEFRGDSEQTFDTVWDETIIAMLKQLHGELLDNLNFLQLEESDLLKHLVALHIQDTVRKSEPKSFTELKRMVSRHLEHKILENHFCIRDRLGEKPYTVVPAVKENGQKIAINGSPTVNAPEVKLAVSSMIQLKRKGEKTRDKEVHHLETQIQRYGR